MTASLRKEGTKYTAAAHAATPHAAIPATWPLLRPIVVQTQHASSVARFAARRSRTQTMKNAKTYQFFDDPKRIMAHFNINLLPPRHAQLRLLKLLCCCPCCGVIAQRIPIECANAPQVPVL